MSDIFREVEEDVRREKLEKFWKAYGDYVIALAAVIIIGIAGFELWQRYEASQRDKASVAFSAAQRISDPKAAAVAFADLAKTAPKGYALLARLEQAHSLLAIGQTRRGHGDLQADRRRRQKRHRRRGAAARRLGPGRHQLARRSGNAAGAAAPAIRRLGADWPTKFSPIATITTIRSAKATSEFNALANDANSPQQLRVRARAMAAFLKQGGAKDFGTVPPPAPVPAPGAVAAPRPGPPGPRPRHDP